MIAPNPAIAALLRQTDYEVAKVQPPDGIVLALPDGTRWAVQAHRLGSAP